LKVLRPVNKLEKEEKKQDEGRGQRRDKEREVG
jgi:hypothetical protein